MLAQNWQNLIRTHVLEKSHRGVLTGAPLTDVRVTLLAGRAHLKHTEGGDFRQAVYRAVRQGLMQAESVLLEPWYSFTAEADAALAGRILSDIPRMGGRYEAPVTGRNGRVAVTGTCPVAQMQAMPGADRAGQGAGAAFAGVRGISSLYARTAAAPGRTNRLRPGEGCGKHAGFRILQPRSGVSRQMERGTGPNAHPVKIKAAGT